MNAAISEIREIMENGEIDADTAWELANELDREAWYEAWAPAYVQVRCELAEPAPLSTAA